MPFHITRSRSVLPIGIDPRPPVAGLPLVTPVMSAEMMVGMYGNSRHIERLRAAPARPPIASHIQRLQSHNYCPPCRQAQAGIPVAVRPMVLASTQYRPTVNPGNTPVPVGGRRIEVR